MMDLKRRLPFITWFPLQRDCLKDDLLSGLTVALLLIPQSMAYADLAGMPAYYGLYAAFVPVVIAALFGSMAQLSSGPTAMTAILTASVLAPYAAPGSPEYIQYAILLTLLIGMIRFLMGSLRMAFLFNFVSHPVIVGFTNAAALIIALSQISKVFGIAVTPVYSIFGDLTETLFLIQNIGSTHWPTLIAGMVSLGMILALKRWLPRIPGVLATVVVMTLLSFLFQFETEMGGRVLGAVPSGFPPVALPFPTDGNWNELLLTLGKMLPGAFVVCIIGFVEISSVTRAISNKTRQSVDLNQELIAQGLSAIAGSFFQSFPTSGSFSRSAMNYQSGGKTTMSSFFTGLAALLIMVFFARFLYHLPAAVLAVSIIVSVYRLMDWRAVVRAFSVKKWDGTVALVTFVSTLVYAPSIVNGVVSGVLLSLIGYLFRTMKPELIPLSRYKDGTLRSIKQYGLEPSRLVLPIRVDGSIYFASIDNIEKGIQRLLNTYPDVRYLLLDGSAVNLIDASGEWGLARLFRSIQERNIILVLGGFKRSSRDVLTKTGLLDVVGKQRDFIHVEQAVQWIQKDLKQGSIDVNNDPLFKI